MKLPKNRIVQHLLPEGRILSQEKYLGRYRVKIDTSYPIERAMFTGTYDPGTQKVIRRFVHPGDTCLDVGANVGAITLGLADAVGSSGTIYSIEPSSVLFDRLNTNIQLNPSIHGVVIPINMGFSNESGILSLVEDPTLPGNASLKNTGGEPVEVITLDSFVEQWGINKLDFVKIDVEGMELHVIRGGMETIKHLRPIIYYETLLGSHDVSMNETMLEIERLLGNIRYDFFTLTHSGHLRAVRYPTLPANTLAIPMEKIDRPRFQSR